MGKPRYYNERVPGKIWEYPPSHEIKGGKTRKAGRSQYEHIQYKPIPFSEVIFEYPYGGTFTPINQSIKLILHFPIPTEQQNSFACFVSSSFRSVC